jgi:hypothetical protein
VIGAASLAAVAAAAVRLMDAFRADDGHGPIAVAVAGCAIVLGALLLPYGAPIVGILALGMAATAIALLALLAVLLVGRGAGPVAALLPVYLLGCGLFVYPSVLFLYAIGNSGIGC